MSGKGTRFILANTEQLHAKIQEMSDRIRHLEDVVQKIDPSSSLLAPDLLSIKSTMGLYSSNGAPTSTTQEKDERGKTNGPPSDDGQRGVNTPRADSVSIDDTAMRVDGPSPIVKSVRHSSLTRHPLSIVFLRRRTQ